MGLMEHKIEGNKAEQTIARELSKPWYRKIESWLTVVNILALLVNIYLLLV